MKHSTARQRQSLLHSGLAVGAAAPALAQQGLDEPFQKPFKEALAGKTVAYVPVAMNFDLTEGWYAGLKKELEPLGVKFEIRDPNWNTNAGAQAVTSLISEKPAVMVVHNPDVQTYAKLLQRAENEGIYVIQINMGSAYRSSALRRRQLDRDRRDGYRRRSSRPARASRTRSRSSRARCRPPPAPTR